MLTAEHETFRRSVRELVQREIEPFVETWEAEGQFPAHDLFPKVAKLGLLGLEYDPKFGGEGADHSFAMVAAEELGRISASGVALGISVQATMATPSLHKFGSEDLKRRYLEPALRGDHVCSIAVTEHNAGSDVAGIRTRANVDGDDWIINGSKMFITNGTQADWICLLARTSDEGGYQGMSQIIVESKTPGFRVSRKLDKLGHRSSDTAELSFENVRVSRANTIGTENRGFQQQMGQFVVERMFGCYGKTGLLQDALDKTRDYLKERTAFGRSLMSNQYVAFKLTELSAQLDLVRTYNHSMAKAYMDGQDTTRQAAVAKLMIGRLSREIADQCLQFHGGSGYMEETWTSRFLRDQRLTSIGGGADEVMLQVLAKMNGYTA